LQVLALFPTSVARFDSDRPDVILSATGQTK